MENREILIANTRTQRRDKVITDATTLGELKSALTSAGIDFSDMTFTEGISKTQLLDDATQLPQNVMYKGNPTNNLVILLTNTKKNIASGSMSRQEAYAAIKEHNLQDEIKKVFGRNFTQVATEALETFLAKNNAVEVKTPDTTTLAGSDFDVDMQKTPSKTEDNNIPMFIDDIITDTNVMYLKDSLFVHIVMLVAQNALSITDLEALKDNLESLIKVAKREKGETEEKKESEEVSTSDGTITDNDIDDMLNDLGM